MTKEQAKAIVMQRMGWDEVKFEEMEDWAQENCNCPDCPTYNSAPEEDKLAFCWPTMARSELIADEMNCICGQCPVFNQADFRFAYYCTRDSEIAQTLEIGGEAAA